MSNDEFQGWESAGKVPPSELAAARHAIAETVAGSERLAWDEAHNSLTADGTPVTVTGSSGVEPLHLEESMRWLQNGYSALAELARGNRGASAIGGEASRLELVTSIALGDGVDDDGRAVRAGFRLGDGDYELPYFFLEPVPRPAEPGEGWLDSGGIWHAGEWFGAVLTVDHLVEEDDPFFQLGYVRSFYQSAMSAAYAMLTR